MTKAMIALIMTATMLLSVFCPFSVAESSIEIPAIQPFGPFNIPENDAMTLLDNMGVGWNLGNTFDAIQDPLSMNEMLLEKYWNGCITTPAMFDALKSAGFRSVRIPVSWHNHVDKDFKISDKWLDRVRNVVNYAYNRGFYIILNTHHDVSSEYYYPLNQYSETSRRYIQSIWSQVAEAFSNYGERLIFESLNEPRLKDTNYEWWIDQNAAQCREAIECINQLNQLFVDTVRASGNKNANRYLMVPGYCASVDGATNRYFRLPSDQAENRIIVSVHAYTPYSFALDANGTSVFDLSKMSQKAEISNFMNTLYKTFIQKGIPVVIGEFGARNKRNNLQSRVDFTAFYTAAARSRNIPCIWWDNGAFSGSGELFGILDRRNAVFTYPEIVTAMMNYQDCRTKENKQDFNGS